MRRNSSVNLLIAIIAIVACVLVLIPIFAGIGNLSDGLNKITCEHKNTESRLTKYSEVAHYYEIVCKDCGEQTEKEKSENHNWNTEGVCTKCKYACFHKQASVTGTNKINDTYHEVLSTCKYCGYKLSNQAIHAFDNGYCTSCRAICGHMGVTEWHVASVNDLQCETWYLCKTCGEKFNRTVSNHNFENNICRTCGYETCGCDQNSEGVTYKEIFTPNVHGSVYICSHGNEVARGESAHSFVNGVCTVCQYECLHSHKIGALCLDCDAFLDECPEGCTEESNNLVTQYTHDGTETGCYVVTFCQHHRCVSVDKFDEHDYNSKGVCWFCGFEKP